MRPTAVSIVGTIALATSSMFAAAQPDTHTRHAVHAQLTQHTIQASFQGHSVEEVFEYLGHVTGVDFIVEWQDEFGFSAGVERDAPVSLTMHQPLPATSILDLVLAQVTDEETSWSVEEGFVRVGTKAALNQHKYIVVYPIHDLLMTVPEFDNASQLDLNSVLQAAATTGSDGGNWFRNDDQQGPTQGRPIELTTADQLIDLIQSMVDPFQWEEFGGDGGSIRFHAGSLIVNAPEYMHRQIGGFETR